VHNNFSPTPRDLRAHEVRVEPDSRLAGILGVNGERADVVVNSIHHQSVRAAPPGVVVTAQSPDGVIEATEIPDKRFALTVQWHPEDLTADDQMFSLFRAFVEAARAGA
jgi:putative glutamine amidotransferase